MPIGTNGFSGDPPNLFGIVVKEQINIGPWTLQRKWDSDGVHG